MIIREIAQELGKLRQSRPNEAPHIDALERALQAETNQEQESRFLDAWWRTLNRSSVGRDEREQNDLEQKRISHLQAFEDAQAAPEDSQERITAIGNFQTDAAYALQDTLVDLTSINENSLVNHKPEDKINVRKAVNEAIYDLVRLAPQNLDTQTRTILNTLIERYEDRQGPVSSGNKFLIEENDTEAIKALRDLPGSIVNDIDSLKSLEDTASSQRHAETLKQIREAKRKNDIELQQVEEANAVRRSKFNAQLSHGKGQTAYERFVVQSGDGWAGKKGLRNFLWAPLTNLITLGNGARFDFDKSIFLSDGRDGSNIAYTNSRLTDAQVDKMVFAFLARRSEEDWQKNAPVILDGYDDRSLMRAQALLEAMGVQCKWGEPTKRMFDRRSEIYRQGLFSHLTSRLGAEMALIRWAGGMPEEEYNRKVKLMKEDILAGEALPRSREECEARTHNHVKRKNLKETKTSDKKTGNEPIVLPPKSGMGA